MFDKKDSKFRMSEGGTQASSTSATGQAPNLSKKSVYIGQSIYIKGELTGNEDLTIEGRVEGNIALKDHNVTIGSNGRIKAEIVAKNITIMGEVNGNVYAEDKLEITKSGKLYGSIVAPRVVIEDGARFKGGVEMDKDVKAKHAESQPSNGKDTSKTGDKSLSMGKLDKKVGAS
ncbi:MAG: polymer-forming cytoskeletal protein [bacterium]|nr:polymer-forming cytoskeletal protein [bacterium]